MAVSVDARPEHMTAPRLPAISGIDRVGIVRAALAGESSDLPTLIDAFHPNHKVTYLCDASAGHALEDVSADEFYRSASEVSGLYGDGLETDALITSTTLPRKLEIGKNAGG